MVNSLKFEVLLLFFILPYLIYFLGSTEFAFFILYLVFFYTFVILKKDKNFDFKSLLKKVNWKFFCSCFFTFFFSGLIYIIILDANLLFQIPNKNFLLWLLIIIVYPFLSVVPQEFIYRVFFFHRYKKLFRGKTNILLALNTVSFAFAHIIFDNIHALIITTIVSPIFAFSYLKKSFLTCIFVHSIGGQIIFTLGLGRYFY